MEPPGALPYHAQAVPAAGSRGALRDGGRMTRFGLALLCGLLAACGGDDDEPSSVADASAADAPSFDANPNAPDANPNAPDASPPDANQTGPVREVPCVG